MTESDDDLRRRILYVAGDGDAMQARIRSYTGARLDEIAAALGLKRQGTAEPTRTWTTAWPMGGI